MENLYRQITDLAKSIGRNAVLDDVKVKAVYLDNGVLIFDPETGWLAIRKQMVFINEISNETNCTYYNEVKYKNPETPYCLKSQLERIFNQIFES